MEGSDPGFLYTLAQFLILITILVFVHELGHYSVARLFGVRVETFSIGFGRELFGWTDRKQTRWKVSWIPLGGYVKFFGDAGAIGNPEKFLARIPKQDHDKCFHFKPLWQRALIVAAGPVVNIVFAALLYAGLFAAIGQYVAEPVVSAVDEGSPAAAAGFQVGDRILSVNGDQVESFEEIMPVVALNPNRAVEFVIERGGRTVTLTAIPEARMADDGLGNEMEVGRLGITSTERFVKEYSVPEALVAGARRTGQLMGLMLETVGRMITGSIGIDELGGPVKIAQYTGQSASLGVVAFLSFMALISVNLGLINLFPIPLLDGGHLLFYGIEAVKGSPLSARTQEMAAMIGLAFVLGLLFVVTWNDLNLPGLG